MVIRLTRAMMKKIKTNPEVVVDPSRNKLCDWGVHLFRFGRLEYIIAVNSSSLLTVIFYGRGITDSNNFTRLFSHCLHERHGQLGLDESFERFVEPSVTRFTWSTVGSPSLLGSINEYIRLAKDILEDQDVCPKELAIRMDQVPMGALKMRQPGVVHRELCSMRLV